MFPVYSGAQLSDEFWISFCDFCDSGCVHIYDWGACVVFLPGAEGLCMRKMWESDRKMQQSVLQGSRRKMLWLDLSVWCDVSFDAAVARISSDGFFLWDLFKTLFGPWAPLRGLPSVLLQLSAGEELPQFLFCYKIAAIFLHWLCTSRK